MTSPTEKIENQTWYDPERFTGIAEQIDRMQNIFQIGSIRERFCGPGETLPFYILKVAEGGDPWERFRFFLTMTQAIDHRVLRGLENPGDVIRFKMKGGIKIYDPRHGATVK